VPAARRLSGFCQAEFEQATGGKVEVMVTYYTLDFEDHTAGLLRRSRTDATSTIESVIGGRWVDDPDAIKYFEGFWGDQLDVVQLDLAEARARAAQLGVDL
jgi:hypothetical protein